MFQTAGTEYRDPEAQAWLVGLKDSTKSRQLKKGKRDAITVVPRAETAGPPGWAQGFNVYTKGETEMKLPWL